MTTRDDDTFVFVIMPEHLAAIDCDVCHGGVTREIERAWAERGEAKVCEDHALVMAILYQREGRRVAAVVYGDQ